MWTRFYYFLFVIALPMGRLTKRKCYRPPKRASWTLELSLPQINLFKVVLKSLKLLMESRSCLPSPRTLRVPCRWPLRIWNNPTQESIPRDPVTCFIEANCKLSRSHMSAARVLLLLQQRLTSSQICEILSLSAIPKKRKWPWHCNSPWKSDEKGDHYSHTIFPKISKKKDTAPGIPRRSPIQVLTRPAVV